MSTYKESSMNKVFGDYGLPKFWGEYTRKRGRFDKKSNFFPLHICMYENHFSFGRGGCQNHYNIRSLGLFSYFWRSAIRWLVMPQNDIWPPQRPLPRDKHCSLWSRVPPHLLCCHGEILSWLWEVFVNLVRFCHNCEKSVTNDGG